MKYRDITLGELIEALAPRQHARPEDGYVELKREHRFYRAARAAIRSGELEASKVPGVRAFIIHADAWHAWIAAHRVDPQSERRGRAVDDVDAWIEAHEETG